MSVAAAALFVLLLAAVGGAPFLAIALACFAGYLLGKSVGTRDA
jgi:hypothetical protein